MKSQGANGKSLRRCVLLMGVLALLAGTALADERRQTGAEPREVRVTAEGASFPIAADAGEFVLVAVGAAEADAVITLRDAEGRTVAQADGRGWRRSVRLGAIAGPSPLELRIAPKDGAEGVFTISLLERSRATAEQRQRLSGQSELQRGRELQSAGKAEALAEALAHLELAAAHYRAAGDAWGEGEALDELGNAREMQADYRGALAAWTEGVARRRAASDRRGEARTLEGVGLAHLYLGNYDEALAVNQGVLEIARETGDRASEAATLHNMGGIYWSTDRMQTALDHYEKALAIERQEGLKSYEPSTLNNIGDVYRRLGDYEKALTYFNDALERRRALGNRRGEAVSLHTIGLVHQARGEADAALDHFRRALEIRKETGDRRGEAYSLGGIALALHAKGDYRAALENQTNALELWKAIGERRAEAETLQEKAFVHLDIGERDEAIGLFEKALPVSRTLSDSTYEARSHFGLARAWRAKGDLSRALGHMEKTISIVESLRGRLSNRELKTSYFASIEKFYEFYIDLLMELHAANRDRRYDARALEAQERARARSLLDALSEAVLAVDEGIDPEAAEQEAKLRTKINGQEQQRLRLVSAERKDEAAIEALEKEIAALLTEYSRLLADVRRTNPRYASLAQPQTLAVGEMQALLDERTALVVYAVGEERSFGWLLTRSGLRSAVLPGREKLEEMARQAYDAARRRDSRQEATGERLQSLSDVILAPLVRDLAADRLVFVGDEVLEYVPYAALAAPDGASLIATYEVVSLPSASVVPYLRDMRRGGGSRIAVLADPVFRQEDPRVAAAGKDAAGGAGEVARSAGDIRLGELRRLRFSRNEALAIAKLAPAGATLQALDFSANRDLALSSDLSDFRIIHFATHGFVNSRYPQLSGLVLSLVDGEGRPQDGFIRLHDIYSMKLSADLVVLSACETALGAEVRGEGLIGLTRGFMHAGARGVVATLWQVDDRATAELMTHFYRALLDEKLTAAAALRRAQLALMRDERWSFPYFWAGFVLQGDWTEERRAEGKS